MGNCFDYQSNTKVNHGHYGRHSSIRGHNKSHRNHRSRPYPPRYEQVPIHKFTSRGQSTWNNHQNHAQRFATLEMCYKDLAPLRRQDIRTHTYFLFNTNSVYTSVIKPFPLGFDPKIFKIDKNYVLMPFSPDIKRSGTSHWSLINKALSPQITSFNDHAKAINMYNMNSNQYNFDVLAYYWQRNNRNETIDLVNQIKTLALSLPSHVTQPIPLLKQGENTIILMSQMQIAALLANAFFCTFPWRTHRNKEYPSYPIINFANLFSSKNSSDQAQKFEKLNCIFNYFHRVIKEKPKGVVSFERKSINTRNVNWFNSSKQFTNVQVHSTGKIEEEGRGFSEVDFANKYIGGGVITSGCVQEEIRFLLSPELIVSRLFTECLAENEALIITGVERFNTGDGYANTFKFKQNYVDHTPRDNWGRRFTQIIAIDALIFKNNEQEQFDKKFIDRELNKAFVGFCLNDVQGHLKPAIVTGKWGCGAFHGDPHLKTLIQMMAASQADRDLIIYTFNDYELAEKLKNLHTILKSYNLNVGKVYNILLNYKKHQAHNRNVIDFLLDNI